jgi:hypothetical protein
VHGELYNATLVVLVRPYHPLRVFVKGARHTIRPSQMQSLRFSTGPRLEPSPYANTVRRQLVLAVLLALAAKADLLW